MIFPSFLVRPVITRYTCPPGDNPTYYSFSVYWHHRWVARSMVSVYGTRYDNLMSTAPLSPPISTDYPCRSAENAASTDSAATGAAVRQARIRAGVRFGSVPDSEDGRPHHHRVVGVREGVSYRGFREVLQGHHAAILQA